MQRCGDKLKLKNNVSVKNPKNWKSGSQKGGSATKVYWRGGGEIEPHLSPKSLIVGFAQTHEKIIPQIQLCTVQV